MTQNIRKPRLLGRLAEQSWFVQKGEVATTRGLSIILEEEAARAALGEFIRQRTGVDVSATQVYLPESVHDDGRRPDLEGLDIADRPRVVVEAKFGAALAPAQILSYLNDQSRRLGPRDGLPAVEQGVFILLVPLARRQEARYKLDEAFRQRHSQIQRAYPIASEVVTWDEWLSMWESSLASSEPSVDSIVADLAQLRSLCDALGGLVIAPFRESVTGASWREKEADLKVLTNEVTKRLTIGKVMPIGDEACFLARRYVRLDLDLGGSASWASIGIRADVADAGGTPVWLRFHKVTGGFDEIRDRLLASALRERVSRQGGHVWISLPLSGDDSGPELVDKLEEQYVTILNVIRPKLSGRL